MGGRCSKPQPQNIYNKYTFGAKLGSGGFGQVREVTVKKTGEVRAAKIIVKKESEENSPVHIDEEIEILKMLNHVNCVRLYDVYEDNLIIYIVMDKLSGGELFDKLEAEVVLTEEVASSICKQMVASLTYIHGLGIAHRDLKPENFLFKTREENADICLIDFGLSKRGLVPGATMSEPCGTLHYVAPEVLRGSYTAKADLWALGVIIFLMLYGYYPYDGANDEQVMKTIIRYEPTWDDVAYELSPEALDFMKRLLDKDCTFRLSADEAMKHSWITPPGQEKKRKSIPIPQDVRRSSVMVKTAAENDFERDKILELAQQYGHLNDQPSFERGPRTLSTASMSGDDREKRTSTLRYTADKDKPSRSSKEKEPQKRLSLEKRQDGRAQTLNDLEKKKKASGFKGSAIVPVNDGVKDAFSSFSADPLSQDPLSDRDSMESNPAMNPQENGSANGNGYAFGGRGSKEGAGGDTVGSLPANSPLSPGQLAAQRQKQGIGHRTSAKRIASRVTTNSVAFIKKWEDNEKQGPLTQMSQQNIGGGSNGFQGGAAAKQLSSGVVRGNSSMKRGVDKKLSSVHNFNAATIKNITSDVDSDTRKSNENHMVITEDDEEDTGSVAG